MGAKSSGCSLALQHQRVFHHQIDPNPLVLKDFERLRGLSYHLTARRGNHPHRTPLDYQDSLRRAIGKAHTFHVLADFQRIIRRAQIENQDLIILLIYILP